jgi:ribosomal protein S18 acetylase RimI-like enzyme
MSRPKPWPIRQLGPRDIAAMRGLLALFGEAFDELETYCGKQPEDAYLSGLLGRDDFIALVSEAREGEMLGGLCAYVLPKFEQARSEIYIYDLAVAEPYRRQGIANALISSLGELAEQVGAHAVFVQADAEDAEAIALYEKHGPREEVLHFDVWAREQL